MSSCLSTKNTAANSLYVKTYLVLKFTLILLSLHLFLASLLHLIRDG